MGLDDEEQVLPEMKAIHDGSEPIEVWVRIEKDADGYPESQDWEELWAWPLGDGSYKIDSIPFFAKGIAAGDIVTTRPMDGLTTLDSVTSRSGHSTFRIWLKADLNRTADQIMADLERLSAKTERTLDHLIAIDAAPEFEVLIWQYLKAGERGESWELQVGYSPD